MTRTHKCWPVSLPLTPAPRDEGLDVVRDTLVKAPQVRTLAHTDSLRDLGDCAACRAILDAELVQHTVWACQISYCFTQVIYQ